MEKCFMKLENQIENLLKQKFETKRISAVLRYFISSVQKFKESDWETSLSKAGKFIEAIIKMLWVYSGKSLPARQKDFKAGVYARKIIDQVKTTEISEDGIRLGIPRASIFIYDITSNRGGRHDSDEFSPNEMDAVTVSALCSWILAELVRFCVSDSMSPDEARKIVESVIERRYPIFEEIEGRIYVDDNKHKSAIQCALMILYKKFPIRMHRCELTKAVMRHKYKTTALKFERLIPFIDIDRSGNILLRATGRKKVEEILKN